MRNLATPPKPRTSVLRVVTGAVSRAVRSLVTPASLFEATIPTMGQSPTVEPAADMFGPDELPPAEDITAAASAYFRAAEQACAADRGKRAARRLLDRLPAGLYGGWKVERQPSSRQTADLDEIRRIFKAHGLGPVPMKASAPSLKVTRIVPAVAPVAGEFEQIAAAFSGKVPAGVA